MAESAKGNSFLDVLGSTFLGTYQDIRPAITTAATEAIYDAARVNREQRDRDRVAGINPTGGGSAAAPRMDDRFVRYGIYGAIALGIVVTIYAIWRLIRS